MEYGFGHRNIFTEISAQRDANTARALAVVRFGHRLLSQTHRQDRLQYTVPQLASAQCNECDLSAPVIGWLLCYARLQSVCIMEVVEVDGGMHRLYLHIELVPYLLHQCMQISASTIIEHVLFKNWQLN